ncbi:unnamed protein product [Sphagnum troendelagicum]|uniref:Nucleotide-diphospho-sugar transferase domain-containing protein n=1 Tax=Sphagnum troendelagicum TaxID=128251 RepID=A0ABP0UH90_9BRYO
MAQIQLKLGVRRMVITALLATFAGVPIAVMLHEPKPLHLQSIGDNVNSDLAKDTLTEIPQLSFSVRKTLGDLLKNASMPNKTVILTPLNHAWVAAGMIDIYFESFREGENIQELVNHIVIVAVDKMVYDSCTQIHPHCFMLRTNGVHFLGEKVYMTEDYFMMTWRKIKFIQNVLEMGYNFIFSIVGTTRFGKKVQMGVIMVKLIDHEESFSESSSNGLLGFIYVLSNKQAIILFKFWYGTQDIQLGIHEQDNFQKMLQDKGIQDVGLKLRFLDVNIFFGYCQGSNNWLHICTMHANCCTKDGTSSICPSYLE